MLILVNYKNPKKCYAFLIFSNLFSTVFSQKQKNLPSHKVTPLPSPFDFKEIELKKLVCSKKCFRVSGVLSGCFSSSPQITYILNTKIKNTEGSAN